MSRKRRVPRGAFPHQRVHALIEMRSWEAAIDEARKVIVHQPDNARAYAYMAQALVELKRYDEALKAAESALRIDANEEWLHRLRGLALRGLDRYEEALHCLEEAVRLSPEEPRALHELLNCQAYCRHWDDMLYTARRYELVAPDLEAPHHFWANALWALGDVDGARAAYEEALRINPGTCPQLHAHFARVLLHDGRTEEAITELLQALRMRPDTESIEACLLYAVRRHLDAAESDPGDTMAEGARTRHSVSMLATQLHLLALRVVWSYRLLYQTDPPPLEYRSPLSEAAAEEMAQALAVWRSRQSSAHFDVLAGLGLPPDLVQSLARGKTVHYPEGLTLDDLLRHWMLTVLDVERGYPRHSLDLPHDRAVRAAIDEIVQHASPDVRSRIQQSLAVWDTRFRDATAEADISLTTLPGVDS